MAKVLNGLENISYEEWLRQLWLSSLEKRRLKGDLVTLRGKEKLLEGSCSQVGVVLFYHVSSEKMRLNDLKLHREKFRLNIRKKITKRMFRHSNKLPWRWQSLKQRLKCLKGTWMWQLGMWLRGDFSGAKVTNGRVDLEGLSQPWWFCGSKSPATQPLRCMRIDWRFNDRRQRQKVIFCTFCSQN